MALRIEINPDCWEVDQVVIDEKTTLGRDRPVTVTKAQWENLRRLRHRGRRLLQPVPARTRATTDETSDEDADN